MESYEKLKQHLPEIAKIVESFPSTLQEKVYETMVSELLGRKTFEPKKNDPTKTDIDISQQEKKGDLSAILTVDPDGQYHSSIRDLKAKNNKDAAKRLVYVLIRAYTKSTNSDTVSRKSLINPELVKWRLSTPNTRGLIANDPGIIKKGDLLSLDQHAQNEADGYIQDILNPEIIGTWKIGTAKRVKRKKGDSDNGESSPTEEKINEQVT